MPLLYLSLAFLAGIFIGKWLALPVSFWLAAAVLACAWGMFDLLTHRTWWKNCLVLPPAFLLCLFFVGGMRCMLALPDWQADDLAFYNDRGQSVITGWIYDPPEKREDMLYLHVRAEEIQLLDDQAFVTHQVHGDMLVRLPTDFDFRMGERIQFIAEPRTPADESDFSYKDYLSRQNIHTVIYWPQHVLSVGKHPVNPVRYGLEWIRQRAYRATFALFPQPEAGLLAGILLGLDNDLPESLSQAYCDTGTAHIIAISGFNMTLIAALLLYVFSRILPRFPAVGVTAAVLVLYSVLVGGSASVNRAAVMAILAMGGRLIGRGSSGPNALGFTAAVMCAFNPLLLWDASFQLSFCATLGLVLFASPLQIRAQELLSRKLPEEQAEKVASPLGEYFLFTFAAQIATLPVIALQFHRFSISSLLSNPLILPFQPAVLVTGGIAVILGTFWQPLGKVFVPLAWPWLAYTNRMVTAISQSIGGSVILDSRLSIWILVGCLYALAIFLLRKSIRKWLGNIKFSWILLILVAAGISIWSVVLRQPDGNLHLDWMRSEESINLVITAPDGKLLAVDPLGSMNELTAAASQSLSPWQHSLDAVLLTRRSAADSLADLDQRMPVKEVLLASPVTDPLDGVSPVEVPGSLIFQSLKTGEIVSLGGDTTLQLAAADSTHAALLITRGGVRVLIPGGVDPALLRADPSRPLEGLSALVLTAADLESVPPAWWERSAPAVILWQDISIAPSADWLRLADTSVFSLVTDGSTYSFEKEH